VVEMLDGDIIGLTSFDNTNDGNLEAKILCYDLIAEDDPNLLEEEIECFVDQGEYESKPFPESKSNYVIKLVVSTEGSTD